MDLFSVAANRRLSSKDLDVGDSPAQPGLLQTNCYFKSLLQSKMMEAKLLLIPCLASLSVGIPRSVPVSAGGDREV